MRLISLVFVFLISASGSFSEVHPLKMSFSKLVISSEGVVDMQTRIFLDDITDQIQKLYGLDSADFSTVESEATKALQQYLNGHFYFEQNGKKSELRIKAVSFSQNRLALALKMTTDKPLDKTKGLFLTNTLLCDASANQRNDIIYLGKSLRLSASDPSVQIHFN